MLIPDVLDAVRTRLLTIDGLTVTTDPGVSPITVPMASIEDQQIEYHATFGRGYDALSVRVRVFISDADSPSGAFEVRSYKSGHGARSIRAALETSAGVSDTFPNGSIVAVTGDTGVIEMGGARWLALDVIATAQIPGK